MTRKINKFNTTDGPRFAIVNDLGGGEIQASASHKYYKTLKGAQKALDDLLD